MAKEKGPYKAFSDKTKGPCVRNETRTSIAPTGTIAILADVFGSIEPHFALEWDRSTSEGMKLKEKISCWQDLDGFTPKTASEVAPEWHVRHQAAFQAHTNLGVSKTINLPNTATKEDVSNIYRMMWEMGCKGGTIFRDGCRDDQVLVSSKTKSVFALGTSHKKKMPVNRQSLTHKFKIGGMTGFLTVGLFDDGMPGEIFLRVSKIGSSVSGLLDTWAISFSIALQNGTPLNDLCEHHVSTRFEPAGITDNKDIPVCTSIPDYVVRWMTSAFITKGTNGKKEKVRSGSLCPDCGSEAIFQAGCLVCVQEGCGWSKCG
jgi:ribonucleoside-diphosphate reductase alpha chain